MELKSNEKIIKEYENFYLIEREYAPGKFYKTTKSKEIKETKRERVSHPFKKKV